MKKISVMICILFAMINTQASESKKELMQKKTSEAVEATTAYTAEQKEEFQKSMEEKLAIIKKEIFELKKTIVNKSEDTQKSMKEQISALEDKEATLQKDLKKLKSKTGKAWDHMKNGVSSAWDEFTTSYEKAKNEYKDKNQ